MVEIEDLRKTYADGREALRGVSLNIGEGMLGLLGPNGAGKTTFLSLLVLVLEPTSGKRTYAGLDAARPRNRSAIRQMIGYLPQDFEPIKHLTGLEYLIHCARIREIPLTRRQIDHRAKQLLDAVFLGEAAGRKAGTYSGGMRRRLGIAQALIHAPKLVVVDEPTAGLDPEERIRFRNLITDVAEETAVLLSTHIVEDIEATCPRIGIIARGKLLFDGAPSEILHQATGRLWQVPAHSDEDPSRIVGRRVEQGQPLSIIYSEDQPPDGRPEEVGLEEAYSAFLLRHGASIEGESPAG